MFKKVFFVTAVVVIAAVYFTCLTGCETVKGTGRDVSNLGRMISGD